MHTYSVSHCFIYLFSNMSVVCQFMPRGGATGHTVIVLSRRSLSTIKQALIVICLDLNFGGWYM